MIHKMINKSRKYVIGLMGLAFVASAHVATKGRYLQEEEEPVEEEPAEGEEGGEEEPTEEGGEEEPAEEGEEPAEEGETAEEGEEGGESLGEEVEEAEEELDVPASTIALCVMSIISVIVLLTILFEMGKDFMLESATEHIKPVVRQMFQELTVLGFLSLFVFLLSVSHVLEEMSTEIFGASELGKEYLTELIEITHYIIFLIMGLNIGQVFLLIFIGNSAHDRWHEFNESSQDEEFMAILAKK